MAFAVRLLLPDISSEHRPPISVLSETEGFFDDDPTRPLILNDVCKAFRVNGVRFEIDGFFVSPLPLSAEYDLIFFLEELPGLLQVLNEKSRNQFTINLPEQGTQ